MLYSLFKWLDVNYDFPGAGAFQYISFRMALAAVVSLFLSMIIGKYVIRLLRKKQVRDDNREELKLAGVECKKYTPTMGGIIILASLLIAVLLFNRLDNIYILLMCVTTVWLGILGFIDDYIKVFKKNKRGLPAKGKLLGQIVLGLFVGAVLFFHPDVVIKEKCGTKGFVETEQVFHMENDKAGGSHAYQCVESEKSLKTTIPFVKNHEFNYAVLLKWLGDGYERWAWLVYIPIIILIIMAVSNGANLTDGLDGLAISTAAVIVVALGVLAYVSGNTIFADYLNIMYIPNSGELMIFAGAMLGACLGFYWWNCHPAQVFMGDTGSLAIGGIIAVFAIIIRKELLLPILCGIYLVESLSVIIQTMYCKGYRKIHKLPKDQLVPVAKRPFWMTPLHHHYQKKVEHVAEAVEKEDFQEPFKTVEIIETKKNYHEAKIVQRFFIIGILLAVLTVLTLKIR
ncbi:MAG: phospho-N-acetylmuramoyl-pentapeptide-transferase [Bacteroidales bacterium]|nr:phospho-N-acetylmuramoyl-pentapeptide-transferase [Bacteroidales bacterium]MBR4512782.1 phospho-N-acetylmuramoyl-pentapeptide-transferase [Bacteroidales bacterium]MBR6918992.1 phospho-N-acetylmuramoyl-pentapeptide-transferase [Bacteroidales bacterium]